ncbi:hypothetical protein GCM10027451_23440 [Geodermatophilus aquaeductus]|uniref:DUF6338 family protein n=1 Tax=Geodermatophilus aquaeductus TaxID=1564161 RepID=UPI00115A68A5|nr:DUF6338 family protein [Geodermatophilus aquaeductus]
MPDSIVALAILAVVGLPGYAYRQLVPDKDPAAGTRSELAETLSVIFFGLPCALAGAVLSLVALPSEWARLVNAAETNADGVASAVVETVPLIVLIVVLGAFTTALGLAGLVLLPRRLRDLSTTGRLGQRNNWNAGVGLADSLAMVALALGIAVAVTVLVRGPWSDEIDIPLALATVAWVLGGACCALLVAWAVIRLAARRRA